MIAPAGFLALVITYFENCSKPKRPLWVEQKILDKIEIPSLQICFFWYNHVVVNYEAYSSIVEMMVYN